MSFTDLGQLVATLGFPIVAWGVTAYGYYQSNKEKQNLLLDITNNHMEETKRVDKAITDLTVAITRLSTLLTERGDDNA